MRELSIDELNEVNGGIAPLVIYAVIAGTAAVVGAVVGYVAGTNQTSTTTVKVDVDCTGAK